jgi:hypothetical protein
MIWLRMISVIKIYLKRIRFWINLLIIADPELVNSVKKTVLSYHVDVNPYPDCDLNLTRVADP